MPSKRDITAGKLAEKNNFMTSEQVQIVLDRIKTEHGRGVVNPPSFEKIAAEMGFLDDKKTRALETALKRIAKDNEKKDMSIEGYEILQKIGEGGLATVYKARQISMNRVVALKILQKQWLSDEEFKKRFLLEARLVGKLSHENLIKVFDVGRQDWKNYYSMEYIEGETVEDILEREGKMDVVKSLRITSQIAKAIDYLKGYGIVHCDIKPGNIMITKNGIAKLADFGFVKVKIGLAEQDGSVLGTPDYISPEQATGSEDIDFRSDIYSLGATLYHMLAGRPPFDGTSTEIMRAHTRLDPEPIDGLRTEVSRKTASIVHKMLEKDPDDRYQSISELEEDINNAIMFEDPDAEDLVSGDKTLFDAFKREKFRSKQWEEEKGRLMRSLRDYKLFFFVAAALMFLSLIINFILYSKI